MSKVFALFTVAFWIEAAERAIKSAAQAVVLGLGLSDTGPVNAFEYDWALAGSFALGAAALSLLTSVGNAAVRQEPTASAVA